MYSALLLTRHRDGVMALDELSPENAISPLEVEVAGFAEHLPYFF